MMGSSNSKTRKRNPPDRHADPDSARWKAVMRRDAGADGTFWYSVSSTGIYCRPSCPSRRPRRENVRFHATPQAAEQEGFRACLRCGPQGTRDRSALVNAVAAACRRLESEYPPSLQELAAGAGTSPFHFHRVFKRITGLTPKAYASAIRQNSVRRHLVSKSTVTEALYAAGYGSGSRFYAHSNTALGMKPSTFRSGGDGETIVHATQQCSLGWVLAAESAAGICHISLGDDPALLVRELQELLPRARHLEAPPRFRRTLSRVVALVENPAQPTDLPLDIRGTAFQKRVWMVLQTIPPGTTLSYSDLATRIGSPRASRAVASACAANTLAAAIPCHRVIGKDGSLAGYRWGIDRKKALLQREAAAVVPPKPSRNPDSRP